MAFTQYEHHGVLVWVRGDLLGLHKEHCLCYSCARFHPEDRAANCPIADMVYALDQAYEVTTPVWTCEHFAENA